MANNASNVSTGKPVVGGAIWTAPIGTTLPTSTGVELDTAFACLGYVSEDGLKNNNSPSVSNIKAWGGDIVATTQTEKVDEFSFELIEALNVDVLKAVYGDDNVTGTLQTGIAVTANSQEPDSRSWVIDMLMNDGSAKRIVIPNGKVTSLGEISYTDSDAIGYDVTVTAFPDSSIGGTHKEYMKAASSSGT